MKQGKGTPQNGTKHTGTTEIGLLLADIAKGSEIQLPMEQKGQATPRRKAMGTDHPMEVVINVRIGGSNADLETYGH